MMPRTLCALALVPLAACLHREPLVGPPLAAPVEYGVAAVVASGPRIGTSVYRLRVEHKRGDIWSVQTVHSEGSWEETGVVLSYDSDTPRSTDPWPILYQHALSAVPAELRWLDGRPIGLVDEVDWKLKGLDALQGVTQVPAVGLESGKALLDPSGFVRDMQRNFPGLPPEGAWIRSERVAGVDATLREQCTLEADALTRTWTCVGVIEAVPGGDATFVDVVVESTLIADSLGLRSFETAWSGAMQLADRPEHRAALRPVAGHRLVQRASGVATP